MLYTICIKQFLKGQGSCLKGALLCVYVIEIYIEGDVVYSLQVSFN